MKLEVWKAPKKNTGSNFYIKDKQTWALPWITLGLWDSHIKPVISEIQGQCTSRLREEKLLLLFPVLGDLANSWKFYPPFQDAAKDVHVLPSYRHNPNVVLKEVKDFGRYVFKLPSHPQNIWQNSFYNHSKWQERNACTNSSILINFQFIKLLNNSFKWCLFWNFWGFEYYLKFLFSKRELRYTVRSIWRWGKGSKRMVPVKTCFL